MAADVRIEIRFLGSWDFRAFIGLYWGFGEVPYNYGSPYKIPYDPVDQNGPQHPLFSLG